MYRRLGIPVLLAVVAGWAGLGAPGAAAQVGPLDCGEVGSEATGQTSAHERQVLIDTIPVGTTWAGHYVGQALLTHGDDQYVGYYDGDRRMTIAHRKIDSDQWTKVQLDETTGWDSHNYITMAVDRAGQLHVSGNMHNDPLAYFRTTTAGDITSLSRVPTMVDPSLESQVTYPLFLHLQDGTLVFRYRDGSSGAGSDVYNQYDENTQTWSKLIDTPLLDGEGERNAYAATPRLGPDGKYHMVWVWRDTPNAATTHTVSYARSADLVNWETSKGEPMTLPITFDTGDVVDPVPPSGGTINNNVQVGFDAAGDPVVAYHKYDEEGNTQVYVARPDGSESGWEQVRVSDWTGAWEFDQTGSLEFQVEIYWPPVLQEDGKLRLDVTCLGEARTFILDGQTLEPLDEIATPPSVPPEVSEVRSDYQHQPEPGELGTEMQVNLPEDLGGASQDRRSLLRWESLGQNRDQPRARWPEPQPLEVVVIGTSEACRNGGWKTFSNPGFGSLGECLAFVERNR